MQEPSEINTFRVRGVGEVRMLGDVHPVGEVRRLDAAAGVNDVGRVGGRR